MRPIDRREFMLTAAAGTAAIGLSAKGSLTASTPAVRIQKALKIGMIAGGTTLAEKFAIARAAGFAGVELDAPSSVTAEEIAEAKAASDLRVIGVVDSVHWAKPLNHPDEAVREEGLAGLERAIRDCDAWCEPAGVRTDERTVLLVPAVVIQSMPYAEAWKLSIASIAKVLPLARELDVRIAIENVWNEFLLSPLEAAAYVDELNGLAGANVVGWYLDIGNIWRYGWPEHWISALGTRIFRLDIKGYSRAKAGKEGKWAGFGVEIDEGDLDWAAVRSALAKLGYTGWATAEVAGGDLERLTDISNRMDRALGL